jgi:hypothetical protein
MGVCHIIESQAKQVDRIAPSTYFVWAGWLAERLTQHQYGVYTGILSLWGTEYSQYTTPYRYNTPYTTEYGVYNSQLGGGAHIISSYSVQRFQ